MKEFSLDYFLKGPYKRAKLSGFSKYLGKYFWARRFYARLISRLTPKGGRILEIGCGFGDLLVFLQDSFHTVGVDVSSDAIKIARKKLGKTKLLILPAEKIGKLHDTFHTIAIFHTLEHLKRPDKVIRSAVRLLNPNGIFIMAVPNPASICRKIKGDAWVGFTDKTHCSLFNPQKWLKIVEENHLVICKKFGDGMWDSPYFPFIPTILQRIFFGMPAVIQTMTTFPFIPVFLGESIVIIAQKRT